MRIRVQVNSNIDKLITNLTSAVIRDPQFEFTITDIRKYRDLCEELLRRNKLEIFKIVIEKSNHYNLNEIIDIIEKVDLTFDKTFYINSSFPIDKIPQLRKFKYLQASFFPIIEKLPVDLLYRLKYPGRINDKEDLNWLKSLQIPEKVENQIINPNIGLDVIHKDFGCLSTNMYFAIQERDKLLTEQEYKKLETELTMRWDRITSSLPKVIDDNVARQLFRFRVIHNYYLTSDIQIKNKFLRNLLNLIHFRSEYFPEIRDYARSNPKFVEFVNNCSRAGLYGLAFKKGDFVIRITNEENLKYLLNILLNDFEFITD